MAASKKSAASTVKRPISRKRIRANRRNARKSTGPKTAQGKRIVSRNALVHGLRSQHFPVLPYEDSAEYQELEDAMERDLQPRGILQRQVVTQMTQISWKLRRIPMVEAAMFMGDRGKLEMKFNRAKEEGEMEQFDALPPPDVAAIIAMHFSNPTDRPYERLEMYRMRLERGLEAATRHFERLRKLTVGAEISSQQQVAYVKEEFNQLMEENRELRAQRLAAERAAAENEAKEVKECDGNCKPAKEMENDNYVGTFKPISPITPSQYPGRGQGRGFCNLKFAI